MAQLARGLGPPLRRSEEWMRQRADKIKEKVHTLFRTSGDVVARMNLVDAIQRLGVSHLFNKVISTSLSDIHATTFNIFKGDDGRFINGIADEPSAYLLVHDEPELKKAISFSRHHLKSMMQCGNLKHPLSDQVKRTLHLPLPRSYKRVETLHYLSEYGKEEGHISFLLDLAKSLRISDNQREMYRVAYAKKEFQKLSHYFLQEAEWSYNNHMTSFEEQVALSTKTLTMQLLCVSTTVGWGDAISNEAFQWAAGSSPVTSCAKIMRLMNDITSFKNNGDIASTVERYMNEPKVISEVAFAKLDSLIEDEWRTMNQAHYEHHQLLPVVQ
uniref:Terpene synthase N-terminal domain-containing protein n=1 Tax=Oryza punctata TaxID=4537 RepID=A0A0E0KP76_ORYPU